MSDANFDALSSLPGHLSSFSASVDNGKVINSTASPEETAREARVAYQLLNDASHLGTLFNENEADKLKRVTVTFGSHYHTFTANSDAIYGIQRRTSN
ncbi:hypothetical protein J3Q64DRAFT_1845479 [Phycomyces blakesleeanus]|uniref:Uncharacterized protein n=2 Tax=Phycomyces blakesleeanus TaxID=4837 RepID=A0ABR3B844_PHYBL